MVNVLHIFSEADIGGVSAVVLNYYSFTDRDKIHFDVALTCKAVGQNGERLRALGASIHFLPLKSEGVSVYKRALSGLLDDHKYDAVHVHDNETSYVALSVAKSHGIPVRVAHAHSAYCAKGAFMKLRRISGRLLNRIYATHLVACGELSGKVIYGKSFAHDPAKRRYILPNSVDVEKYSFDPEVRDRERRRLKIENRFAVGSVGRLSPEKNVRFSIDLIGRIRERIPGAIFLIAGDGPEKEELEAHAAEIYSDDEVRFLGKISDTSSLYSALDLLVMPSEYEGYPVVAAEALCTGLPMILSENITKELSFSGNVSYADCAEQDKWVELSVAVSKREGRLFESEKIREHRLDIRDTVRILEDIYIH